MVLGPPLDGGVDNLALPLSYRFRAPGVYLGENLRTPTERFAAAVAVVMFIGVLVLIILSTSRGVSVEHTSQATDGKGSS
jgi:hypothetical protein